jgi:anti-sigma regulatory factor (Ser/Thr protein kinase)
VLDSRPGLCERWRRGHLRWVESACEHSARIAERKAVRLNDARARKPSTVPRTVLLLPYDPKSALRARRFVEQFVADRKLDGRPEVLCLIASELVANAVLHGTEPVELTLQYQDGEVTIEVADGDPRIDDILRAVDRAVDQTEAGGRGLRVVATLAERWGTRPLRSGKVVWATASTTLA